jgi:hypothetical protein
MIASLPLQAALWGLVAHGCRNLRDHCPPAPAGLVTRFLLAVDMALANTAPDGYGHAYYGPDYVRLWVAVTSGQIGPGPTAPVLPPIVMMAFAQDADIDHRIHHRAPYAE